MGAAQTNQFRNDQETNNNQTTKQNENGLNTLENIESQISPRQVQQHSNPTAPISQQALKRIRSSRYSIFNNQYEILKELGDGKSARVYLAKDMDTAKLVAVKLIRHEYLKKDQKNVAMIETEIIIQSGLSHPNITGLIAYGSDGVVVKASGRQISQLVYMILEYTPKCYFEVCKSCGALGENAGRFLISQLANGIGYMHTRRAVTHRDLKLENLLVDQNMNIKIADFGLAQYQNIQALSDYVGTKSYMAPEIKDSKIYDGRAVDIFSMGVIMFISVVGTFPFQEARNNDYFYQLILSGSDEDLRRYWRATQCDDLSTEFKNLFLRMVSFDPSKRPTIQEFINDAWMQTAYDQERTRNGLIAKQNSINPVQQPPKKTEIKVYKKAINYQSKTNMVCDDSQKYQRHNQYQQYLDSEQIETQPTTGANSARVVAMFH